MKIAISNIAWREDEEAAVAELMQRSRVRGVEIAPGKMGPKPAEMSVADIQRYRAFWNERDIQVVALQALLFGTEGLHVFQSGASRRDLLAYLTRIVSLGAILGAETLVFGSPKNRLVGALDARAIDAIAVPFFRAAAAIAADHGVRLCLEPIPPASGADWITTAREAQAFLKRVDHPGLGLHLDAGALHVQAEGADEIRSAGSAIRHFHASQPGLVPLAPGGPVPHEDYAATLREIGYPRWVSIEMRDLPGRSSSLSTVETALRFASSVYGP